MIDYDKTKRFRSTTRVSMATKLGKMATYLNGFLLIKSHEPLIT